MMMGIKNMINRKKLFYSLYNVESFTNETDLVINEIHEVTVEKNYYNSNTDIGIL